MRGPVASRYRERRKLRCVTDNRISSRGSFRAVEPAEPRWFREIVGRGSDREIWRNLGSFVTRTRIELTSESRDRKSLAAVLLALALRKCQIKVKICNSRVVDDLTNVEERDRRVSRCPVLYAGLTMTRHLASYSMKTQIFRGNEEASFTLGESFF